jgi:hypothetical protein
LGQASVDSHDREDKRVVAFEEVFTLQLAAMLCHFGKLPVLMPVTAWHQPCVFAFLVIGLLSLEKGKKLSPSKLKGMPHRAGTPF